MCVVKAIDAYLSRIKTFLSASFIKPQKEVVSSTVSGWIKKTLSLAGTDTEQFKGYPTELASTSKSALSGLALADILARDQWSRKFTRQKIQINQFMLKYSKHEVLVTKK